MCGIGSCIEVRLVYLSDVWSFENVEEVVELRKTWVKTRYGYQIGTVSEQQVQLINHMPYAYPYEIPESFSYLKSTGSRQN